MTSKLAFVFPGQGSQFVGMLNDFFADNPAIVNAACEEASDVLGYDIAKLITEDAERLNKTEYTQPALLTAGVIAWRIWQQECTEKPVMLAGHSLGEYAALVCASALSFADGLNPTRSNYVAGVSIAWNIMSLSKIKHQVSAQRFLSLGYANEADLISTRLKDQLVLADQRIANVMQRFNETPVQYKAASDAYLQKTVLYKNGLTDIVDVQQALFALNKAETDLGISYIAVWQALLLKCAASGDFNLFSNQAQPQ